MRREVIRIVTGDGLMDEWVGLGVVVDERRDEMDG
jgi:hypothetical protein